MTGSGTRLVVATGLSGSGKSYVAHALEDIGYTTVASDAAYWRARDGAGAMQTIGVFARKGLWLPVPSMEVGFGAVHGFKSSPKPCNEISVTVSSESLETMRSEADFGPPVNGDGIPQR